MDLATFALGGLTGVVVAGGIAAVVAGGLRRARRASHPASAPPIRTRTENDVARADNRPVQDTRPAPAVAPPDAPGVPPGGSPRPAPPDIAAAGVAALRAGVLVLDAAGRVVLANPAAYRLGLVRADTDAGVGTAHSMLNTIAGRVTSPGARRDVDLELRAHDLPDGVGPGNPADRFGVRVRLVGLADGYVAMEAEDVTEAHRVARVRRDFVANVSHELKTPVGALQLLGEALVDALDTIPSVAASGGDTTGSASSGEVAARRFADRIAHEASRLGRLVSELLELSRLQGAEPLPAPDPVAADRIVAEVVDRTRTTAQAKQIAVTSTGERGRTVYGNETQLATALSNLVENAVAYSPAGTTVTIAVRRGNDAVLISVADQGIGIEPADLDRIFERFYRADKARSRATGGTGLGLAIVKHIATNHGGRVDVVSAVGAGSTFTLRLPARPPHAIAVEHNPGEIAEDIGTAAV